MALCPVLSKASLTVPEYSQATNTLNFFTSFQMNLRILSNSLVMTIAIDSSLSLARRLIWSCREEGRLMDIRTLGSSNIFFGPEPFLAPPRMHSPFLY